MSPNRVCSHGSVRRSQKLLQSAKLSQKQQTATFRGPWKLCAGYYDAGPTVACLHTLSAAWPTYVYTYHGLQLPALRGSDEACFANLVHCVWLASKLRLRKGRQLFLAAPSRPHKHPAAGADRASQSGPFRFRVAWQTSPFAHPGGRSSTGQMKFPGSYGQYWPLSDLAAGDSKSQSGTHLFRACGVP